MPLTFFKHSIWTKSAFATLAVLASCTEALPPEDPAPTCDLPTEDVHVVQLTGAGEDYVYVLMSDGQVWFWGSGYSPHPTLTEPEREQLCISQLSVLDFDQIALSTDGRIHLLNYQPYFSFSDFPHELSLSGATPRIVRADAEFFALDEAGEVWNLQNTDFRPAGVSEEFVRVPFTDLAVNIVADNALCAVLQDKSVECVAKRLDEEGRFGMGLGANVLESTVIPATDCIDFAMSTLNSCWLDTKGVARCAGSAKSGQLGYEWDSDMPSHHGSYEEIPGLPPLRRIWMRSFGACSLDHEDSLWCWGYLGYPGESHIPVSFGTFPGAKEVMLGWNATCLLDDQHRVFCYGLPFAEYSCEPAVGEWHQISFGPCEEEAP